MSTLSADAKQLEKMIVQEAKADEKNLQHFIKDLKSADKASAKAAKSVDKAIHGVDKAVKQEHKTAAAMTKAEHKHNVAVQEISRAQKEVEMHRRQQADLEADLERKRQAVDAFQQRKEHNDQVRETRLAELHQHAADAAVSRANTVRTASPTGTHHTSEGIAPAMGESTVGAGGATGATGVPMEQPRVAV